MTLTRKLLIVCLTVAVAAAAGYAFAEEKSKLVIGGTTYTKWLWGNMRNDGSVYSFTTVPGEGYGDNGQGSEVELLLDAKLSRAVEVRARLHSRFNQNQWTNYGGFGGRNPAGSGGDCLGGDCGEFDPRSNQYVKLRGVAVILTPGYKWIDSATIGANDFGQFDPFVIGRIRYIDRDNASGLLFQGSAAHRKFTWDATRISLPRLWAGPNFATGDYTAADAAYGFQFKVAPTSTFDIGGIVQYVYDQEVVGTVATAVDPKTDLNIDNGRDIRTRFRNSVGGIKFGVHPGPKLDFSGAYYYSTMDSVPIAGAPASFGLTGFSATLAGKHQGNSWKADLGVNDIGGSGLGINFELFSIGAEYVSMMASRRESDVLLTEGHDSAFAFPGPSNASFGVYGGNPTRIGYGGWDGNAVQVATVNVDNEFTDFDEPMAETVIGWKGITVVPTWTKGALELSGEYTHLGYNTNWQAWGNDLRSLNDTPFPSAELDTGVGHNFRSAYAPFQDKKTDIALAKFKYTIESGKGIDLFGKVKYIKETDNRLTDPRFLPFVDGDCALPPSELGCNNVRRLWNGFSTADIYPNPPVITVNGVTGYAYKPFNDVSDDDRDLKYYLVMIGAGYQLSNDLYGTLSYEYFDADLKDGTTAFQGYGNHEWAAGKHKKNRVTLKFKYILAGAEIGWEYQYVFGTFDPASVAEDIAQGFVPQFASLGTAQSRFVPVGSPGFQNFNGFGFQSLAKRTFDEQRIKAFMTVQFCALVPESRRGPAGDPAGPHSVRGSRRPCVPVASFSPSCRRPPSWPPPRSRRRRPSRHARSSSRSPTRAGTITATGRSSTRCGTT